MFNEKESVLRAFEVNFQHCHKMRIAFWGDEKMITALIKNFPEYNIVGLVTETSRNKTIGGKRVILLEDINMHKIDMIIRVAIPSKNKEDYWKLDYICGKAGIQIFSIDGTNLCKKFEEIDWHSASDEQILFKKRLDFTKYKSKKMVIYGTGSGTKMMLDGLYNFNIIGLMDKIKSKGKLWEKPILTYEQVLEQGVEVIMTVTREESLQYVYRRIYYFCLCHHILLIDQFGNDLLVKFGLPEELIEPDSYFTVKESDLIDSINTHNTICFDIFDTLLMFQTLVKDDAFAICEKRKDLSITQLMIARDKMLKIFHYAVAEKKKVYLISDLPLNKKVLCKALKEHRIDDFEDLLLTGDGEEKGTLIKSLPGFTMKDVLYITADQNFELVEPEEQSLDIFYVKSAVNMLDISSYGRVRTILSNINERSLVGLFVSRVFNNPFVLHGSQGKVNITELSDIGYLYLAPMTTAFILWISAYLEKESFDAVLFSARDGYLYEKLYSRFKSKFEAGKLPESIYFLISRRAASNASLETISDITNIFSLPYEKEPESVLKDKFLLDTVPPYDEQIHGNLLEYAILNKELIFEKSREQKANYLKYTEDTGLKKGGKYALFDMASSGTSQYYFSKIMPFSVKGTYLCWYDVGFPEKRKLPITSMYCKNCAEWEDSYKIYADNGNLYMNYVFLEPFMTSEQASLRCFDKDGKPVYREEERDVTEIERAVRVQASIEEYFETYIDKLWIEGYSVSSKIPELLYNYKNSAYTNEMCRELNNMINRDDLGAPKVEINRG